MIVPSRASGLRLAKSLVAPALYFAVVTVGVAFAYAQLALPRSVFTLATAGLMITSLSIFLGFRVSEAYDRWWEARKLWGALVNVSRSFGRKVSALVVTGGVATVADEAAAADARRNLVHRHLAYVHALRIGLRHGPAIASAPAEWEAVRPFLQGDELAGYANARNVATQILATQGDACRRLFGASAAAQLAHLDLQRMLDQLCDVQGACERIKNTEFPWAVTATTQVLVWGFATLLPLAALDADVEHAPMEMLLIAVMSLSFVLVERLGRELKKPFDNQPNDTPMTALCRTIEIDLRQMLGEAEVPPPIVPVDGILM